VFKNEAVHHNQRVIVIFRKSYGGKLRMHGLPLSFLCEKTSHVFEKRMNHSNRFQDGAIIKKPVEQLTDQEMMKLSHYQLFKAECRQALSGGEKKQLFSKEERIDVLMDEKSCHIFIDALLTKVLMEESNEELRGF
jgi:hypothetical protein